MEIKLASTRECDTYSIVKQQRIRGACAKGKSMRKKVLGKFVKRNE